MTSNNKQKVEMAARNEITEHYIYRRAASRVKDPHNRKILEKIAAQEKEHYNIWSAHLGYRVKPSSWKIKLYTAMTILLGLSFTLKLMEKGEKLTQEFYNDIGADHPAALTIVKDEQQHERQLLDLINEKFLGYVSSIVLGLNDALVELTGALAGLTLALQNTRLIAVVGLITGIAASLSMATSEYLSTKEEKGGNPIRAGIITGITYLVTVFFLISPYLVLDNAIAALISTLMVAIVIILLFTFYTAIAKGLSFPRKFTEMATISLVVAGLNFIIGYAIKIYFGM